MSKKIKIITGSDIVPGVVRIDKWLWSVRICKTRAVATDLCKRQKVLVDDEPVKPSRSIYAGQEIVVRRDGVNWHYRVLQCIDKRVGAPVARECCDDITPAEERNKLALIKGSLIRSYAA